MPLCAAFVVDVAGIVDHARVLQPEPVRIAADPRRRRPFGGGRHRRSGVFRPGRRSASRSPGRPSPGGRREARSRRAAPGRLVMRMAGSHRRGRAAGKASPLGWTTNSRNIPVIMWNSRWQWNGQRPTSAMRTVTLTVRPGGTITTCLRGLASPAPLSRSIQSPCRWIGWFIMVSFLRTSRTVSPSVKCISGALGIFPVVERPDELVHVAGQPDLDGAVGRAERIGAIEPLQVGVAQHLRAGRRVDRRHMRPGPTYRDPSRRDPSRRLRMIHAAMAHIRRREQAGRAQHRQRSGHARARRQGRAGKTAAVDRLRLDGVGAVFAGLDDHVVGLADADPELVDVDRLRRRCRRPARP